MKKIIITTLLTLIAVLGYGQELRHSQGNKGLDLTYHKVKPGSAFSLGYVQFIKQELLLKAKINYEKGKIDFLETKIWQFIPTIGYSIPILQPTVFLTGEVGFVLGTEDYSNENFIQKESGIIYGGVYGLETEIYVNNNIAFLLNATQIYAKGSELSPHRFQVGGGIRLIIQ